MIKNTDGDVIMFFRKTERGLLRGQFAVDDRNGYSDFSIILNRENEENRGQYDMTDGREYFRSSDIILGKASKSDLELLDYAWVRFPQLRCLFVEGERLPSNELRDMLITVYCDLWYGEIEEIKPDESLGEILFVGQHRKDPVVFKNPSEMILHHTWRHK